MSAAAHAGLGLLPGGGLGRARSRSDWLVPGIVALLIVAVLVAIVSASWSDRRGLRGLPEEQRRGLLSRTVDELRQLCGAGRPEALKDRCHEIASFAAQFDECRGECEMLVRRQPASAPTR